MTECNQRFSSIQKNTLFLLYVLEEKGHTGPVAATELLRMQNDYAATHTIHRNNFGTSCSRLVMTGHLKKFISKGLRMSYGLSELGREKARDIHKEKMANV